MIGAKSSSSVRPAALGTTVSSATEGQVIPVIYGRTKQSLYPIWAANKRQGGSKFKAFLTKGKNAQNFITNIDFLLGHNPILGVLQFWQNQDTRLPLNFAKIATGFAGQASATITDPNFYFVIGVTVTATFAATFNDYGSQGTVSLSENSEHPLFNVAMVSSDPTNPPELRFPGSCYRWTPDMGNVIDLYGSWGILGNITVYYAQLDPNGSSQYSKKNSNTDIPVAALSLTFEPELGDGPEFTGNNSNTGQPLNQQQLIYPPYAGLGSSDFSLGSAGMLPQTWSETVGSFGVHATGDADFCDMAQDIICSGLTQAAFNSVKVYSTVKRGVGFFEYPGPVQCWPQWTPEQPPAKCYYPRKNVVGAPLLVSVDLGQNDASSISSSDGETWTERLPGVQRFHLWTTFATGGAVPNTVSVTGSTYNNFANAIELGGVDTLDAHTTATGSGVPLTLSVTTTNLQNTPCILVLWTAYNGFGAGEVVSPFFKSMITWGNQDISTRTVYRPGTYTVVAGPNINGAYPDFAVLLAYKLKDPQAYGAPLGRIIDQPSLELCRTQCRAYGLYGSLLMDSQQNASEWLQPLYKAMNAWPVYAGFSLYSFPLAEQSFIGNGSVYIAPTSTGPLYDFKESDFIGKGTDPPIKAIRKAQFDIPNSVALQCVNRSSDYNEVLVTTPVTGAVALYGPRKASPQQFRMIQDVAIARRIAHVLNSEQNFQQESYQFTLPARFSLTMVADLYTIPEASTLETVAGQPISIKKIPIRITKVTENEDQTLNCEAEQYKFGVRTPLQLTVTNPTVNIGASGSSAGPVNPPIIFEPVPRLISQQNQGQIWFVVSAIGTGQLDSAIVQNGGTGYSVGDVLTVVQTGATGGQVTVTAASGGIISDVSVTTLGSGYANGLATVTGGTGTGAQFDILITANYGGCIAYVSTDGGASYSQIPGGTIQGNGTTGKAVTDWPIANDPDTTNDLLLDLTESRGVLNTITLADEDNFAYICYIAGGNSCIPYELLTYAVDTLTAPYKYTLKATGGGNHLRRAVFGAPAPGIGSDHPIGSRFAYLGPVGTSEEPGILKTTMDPTWIGRPLKFKFLSFNSFGGGLQSLTDAVAYSYTPTGVAQQSNPNNVAYIQNPAIALSNPTSTSIAMSAVTVQFPSGSVKYNARTFTIPAPTVATWYYVTIADPTYVGDTGSGTTLTATCQASQALVGIAGNTFIGAIAALPSGGATIITRGGWPPQQMTQLV